MTTTIDQGQMQANASPFAPPPPLFHHEPLKLADDTYLIRMLSGEGTGAPIITYVNSMVILGQEPVIVDAGTMNNRSGWLNDVFSLVDPKDVRWIFISHDDHDHVGNLPQLMELCTNATLVSSWFQVERLSGDLALPLNRMRWLGDGESFDAGDRILAAVRPPSYDAPTTRGLYDPKTGIYWASDSFASVVTRPMDDVSAMHPDEWRQLFSLSNMALSPWIELTDPVKFNASVERIAKLMPSTIVSAHTPVIAAAHVRTALDMMFDMPFQPQPELPRQADLEAILQAMAAAGI